MSNSLRKDPTPEETLGAVLRGTAPARGEKFLRGLVTNLADALRMRYALVTECVEGSEAAPRVRTLAFSAGGRISSGSEWLLAGTPCEEVIRDGVCRTHPRDLPALFPDDAWLAELGAVAYVGAPLVAPSGRLLGHLAAFDVEPLADPARALAILELFAVRAAAELERRWLDQERDRVLARLREVTGGDEQPRMVAICAWCRRIRDAAAGWLDPEAWLARHSRAGLTHGICPACREQVRA